MIKTKVPIKLFSLPKYITNAKPFRIIAMVIRKILITPKSHRQLAMIVL